MGAREVDLAVAGMGVARVVETVAAEMAAVATAPERQVRSRRSPA